MKKFGFVALLVFCNALLHAQQASIATDVTVLRSFTKGSKFWAIGQTVQGQYHTGPKTTAYAWVSYYTNGHFKNTMTAQARDSTTIPQQLQIISRSTLRFRQFSLGFRHYFKGSYNSETDWSLYGLGGFGLLLIKATNAYDKPLDTTTFFAPQQARAGTKNLVRLTGDLGLGVETMLGAGVYLYADVRTWVQASSFASPYLYNNDVPRVVVLSGGLRILFE